MPMPRGHVVKSLEQRLMDKVITVPYSGCWVWLGATAGDGYGVMQLGSRGQGLEYTHRIAYRLYRGAIPNGLEIDHLCRIPCCCNPNHLEVVSRSENNRRGLLGVLDGRWGKNAPRV